MNFHFVRLFIICFIPLAMSSDVPTPKDFTDVSLKRLGIKLAELKKDSKTGFVVAGKNSTSVIKRLTRINEISIDKLERELRFLFDRYLRDEDSLITEPTNDNKYVVDDLGLTHQALAKHLHIMGAIWLQRKEKEFRYHARKFKVVHRVTWTVPVASPFADGSKVDDTLLTVHNLTNGKKVDFYRLIPFTIERYGFYGGRKTRRRVEPSDVVEVLDFLKDKAKKN